MTVPDAINIIKEKGKQSGKVTKLSISNLDYVLYKANDDSEVVGIFQGDDILVTITRIAGRTVTILGAVDKAFEMLELFETVA